MQAQPPAQLLQEHRQAFRRPQKQQRIYLGNINSLVENIYHEQVVEFPAPQLRDRRPALLRRGVAAGQVAGIEAGGLKLGRHQPRMFPCGAKAQGPRLVGRQQIALQGAHNSTHPHIVAGVHIGQVLGGVAPIGPPHVAIVYGVRDAEILKRHQQPPRNCFRQPDFCRDGVIEVRQDAFPIGPLRRGRQPQQNSGLKPRQNGPVGSRGQMVHLVNYQVLVIVARDGLLKEIQPRREGLHRHKQVFKLQGLLGAHPQFPKVGLPQNMPERGAGLPQNLLPVRYKQQPRQRGKLLGKPGVVKCRHNRFARARRRHHQVAEMPPQATLHRQPVQDFLLIRKRTNAKVGQ